MSLISSHFLHSIEDFNFYPGGKTVWSQARESTTQIRAIALVTVSAHVRWTALETDSVLSTGIPLQLHFVSPPRHPMLLTTRCQEPSQVHKENIKLPCHRVNSAANTPNLNRNQTGFTSQGRSQILHRPFRGDRFEKRCFEMPSVSNSVRTWSCSLQVAGFRPWKIRKSKTALGDTKKPQRSAFWSLLGMLRTGGRRFKRSFLVFRLHVPRNCTS